MTKHKVAVVSMLATLGIVAAACGNRPAPVVTLAVTMMAPTTTPVPPTATPVPPTDTPITPATAQPGDNALNTIDDAIQATLLKTSTSATYRIQMTMTGSGQPFAALAGDAETEVPLMAVAGEYSQQNVAFTMSGLATALMGGGPDGVQFITAGGKTYLHGPLPLLSATEDRWYVLPEGPSNLAQAPVDTDRFLQRFTGESASQFAFTNQGSQPYDGHTCDVYQADAQATQEALASFGANAVPGARDLTMQAGEFNLWSCDDGYIHRMQMRFELGSKDDQAKVILFKAEVRLYDHGADVTVVAPADAAPLNLPTFDLPTPES